MSLCYSFRSVLFFPDVRALPELPEHPKIVRCRKGLVLVCVCVCACTPRRHTLIRDGGFGGRQGQSADLVSMERCRRLRLDGDRDALCGRLEEGVRQQSQGRLKAELSVSRLRLDSEATYGARPCAPLPAVGCKLALRLGEDDERDLSQKPQPQRHSQQGQGMGQAVPALIGKPALRLRADDMLLASSDLSMQPEPRHRLQQGRACQGVGRPGPAGIGIEAFVRWMHDQCDSACLLAHFTRGNPCTWASLCSGLDAGSLGRAAFCQEWNRRHVEDPVQWEPVFACELDSVKLGALVAMQPRLRYAFSNVHDVGAGQAWDILSGSWQEPPSVTWLDVGIPCLPYSSMNCQRAETYNSGESNAIFASAFGYIRRKRPRYVMFENVSCAQLWRPQF